jgi:hypothetical protein
LKERWLRRLKGKKRLKRKRKKRIRIRVKVKRRVNYQKDYLGKSQAAFFMEKAACFFVMPRGVGRQPVSPGLSCLPPTKEQIYPLSSSP